MSTPSVNARSHLAHLASRPTDGPYPNLTPPPSMVHCQVGSQYLLTPEKRDGRSHGQEGTERYTVSSPSQPKQDEQDPQQTAVNASTAGYLALIGWWHSAHLPLTISQPSNGRL